MIATPRDCSVVLLTKHCRRKKCSVDRCAWGRYRSDEAATTMRMPRRRLTIATHIATSSRSWFASDRESCTDHLRQIDDRAWRAAARRRRLLAVCYTFDRRHLLIVLKFFSVANQRVI